MPIALTKIGAITPKVRKPSYLLYIDSEEQKLLSFEVTHSVYTPSGVCICEIELPKEVPDFGTPMELHLGWGGRTEKVFKGYTERVELKQNRLRVFARNHHLFWQQERLSGCLKDVTPKEVLEFLNPPNGFVLADRPYDVRHHFLIWNQTKEEVVKQILKAWNLKGFTFWWDLEEKFHLHPLGEFASPIREIPKNEVIAFRNNTLIGVLNPNLFVNQKVVLNGKEYLTAVVKHISKPKWVSVVELVQ